MAFGARVMGTPRLRIRVWGDGPRTACLALPDHNPSRRCPCARILSSEWPVREAMASFLPVIRFSRPRRINDDESGLLQDIDGWLEKLAPHAPVTQYRHNDTGEDNADAHLKRQVMGREVTIAVTKGKLDFGPWEQIFYGEFDGRRDKRVLVKIIGE